MTEASPARALRETREALGGGDCVSPAEECKRATVAVTVALGEVDVGVLEENRGALAGELDRLLAFHLPLLEYGTSAGAACVTSSLRYLADSTAGSVGDPVRELALHMLVQIDLTYLLAHDRLDLEALSRVVVVDAYSARTSSILGLDSLRHARALAGEANQSAEAVAETLGASTLRAELPYLAQDQVLEPALAEAELISAMLMAATHSEDGVYCHSLGRREGRDRLRQHAASQPEAVAQVFGIAGDLAPALNERFAKLAGPDRRAPREPLIPVEGAS